ncbi:MAG: hypothetical protein F4X76_05930 [Chloroflexi bacterium]|nr:hypothetical protein [Chloroflexota bacterium]
MRRRDELLGARPDPAPAAEPVAEPPPAPPDSVEARVFVPPDPPPPPPRPPPSRPPAAAIGEWAARRQADILLYLGAFLLVISALIFASSRDETIVGGWRVLMLAGYTAAFIAAGLLLRRWPRVREAGPVFLAIGALLTPLNFLLLHNEVLGDHEVSGAVVWFAASAYSTAFYSFLFARGHGRLYALPAAIALLNAWGSFAIAAGWPIEWSGAWWMGFALAAGTAFSTVRRWSVVTVVPVAVIAVLALLFSNLIAAYDAFDHDVGAEHRWELPVTYALLAALVAVAGWSVRQAFVLLAVVVLAAVTALAAVWAAELPAQWYSAPPLAAVALLLLTRHLWSDWSPQLSRGAWLLMAAGLLWPFLLSQVHLDGNSWGAATAFLAAAVLAAAVAWRNTGDGVFAPDWDRRSTTSALERAGFGWVGFGALLAAIGFTQRALEVDAADAGWAFAALGAAVSASLVYATPRAPALFWVVLPALLLVTYISLPDPDHYHGHTAILLAVPSAHLLVAFALVRRWSLAAVATALGMLALAALWEAQAWRWWQLAALYAAGAIPLFGVLTPLRRYRWPDGEEPEILASVQALSWLPLAAAVAAAFAALDDRVGDPPTVIEAASTVEYRALVLTVLPFAPLVAFEAWRFRRWEPTVLALVVLLGSAAALWPVFDWPAWTLAAAYAAGGAGGFAALTRWRRYAEDPTALAVQALSWLTPAVAVLTAWIALVARLGEGDVQAPGTAEYQTFVLVALLFAPLISYEAWRFRRAEPTVLALVVLLGCVAALWPTFDWPAWTLAAAYAAGGAGGFAALTRWRRYAGDRAALVVQALSWLTPAVAVLTAWIALGARIEGVGSEAPGTAEYQTVVLVTLLVAPLISYEAWRFRRSEPLVLALLVVLGSVAALWPVFDWPTWVLACTYAVAGGGGFLALSRWRTLADDPAALAVQALSWLTPAAAVLTAVVALDSRLGGAGAEAPGTVEYRALVLVTFLLAPLFAYEAWRLRRWEFAIPALTVVFGSAAALWPVFDWPTWTLATAYSLAGAGAFLALGRWRGLGDDWSTLSVHALSWAGLVLGPLVALQALGVRLETIEANPATLVEFRVLTALLLPLAAAVEFDGRRLGIGWASLPASAVVMVALELAIATLEPANVQAHTVPAALYLALVGLLARTSETLSRHLGWHELLQLAGAALLVLPQAEQGFEPGGARWGLVLLLEGIVLLGIAMALGARWLGVSAVVTLSGVALRFLWVNRDSDAVPHWVMLAVAGFVLLAIGLTVLLQRDWWDRTRLRIQAWWRRDAALDARSPLDVPVPALFTALAPVLAILVFGNPD